MILATKELNNPSMSTGAVADAVGYQSEAAFQRAFKGYMGVTPAQWRKAQEPSNSGLLAMSQALSKQDESRPNTGRYTA
jgi:AraC family transcriptional regulator, activator of mtrCDE